MGRYFVQGKDRARICNTMDAQKYTDVLDKALLPFMESKYGADDDQVYFQQDNASCHNAKHTNDWFYDMIVPVLEWPAKSPDLNPIENAWSVLVPDLYANNRQFMDVDHLKEAFTLSWDRGSLNTIRNMTMSLPKRCADVVLARGGPTK